MGIQLNEVCTSSVSIINGEKVLLTFIGLHNYESPTKCDSNYAIASKHILFDQKR